MSVATLPSPSGTATRKPDRRRGVRPSFQRDRLTSAVIEHFREGTFAELTVATILARTRMSRSTFYELFDGREACFLGSIEDAVAEARTAMSNAYAAQDDWQPRVRAALAELLLLIDREPLRARVCLVHSLTAGGWVQEYRGRLLSELAAVLDRGADGLPAAALTGEVLAAGIAQILQTRLEAPRHEPMIGLLGPLMATVVLPYLGAEAALAELRLPPPELIESRDEPVRPACDALSAAELGFRITYRTARVLMAIDAHPGATNRRVARHAGISDNGQISKLLHRLEGLGLVENRGPGRTTATAPNAWYLTARGVEAHTVTCPG